MYSVASGRPKKKKLWGQKGFKMSLRILEPRLCGFIPTPSNHYTTNNNQNSLKIKFLLLFMVSADTISQEVGLSLDVFIIYYLGLSIIFFYL